MRTLEEDSEELEFGRPDPAFTCWKCGQRPAADGSEFRLACDSGPSGGYGSI